MGVFTSCGLVALEDWEQKIREDNENASYLAHELAQIEGIIVNEKEVETNILRCRLEPDHIERLNTDYRGFSARMRSEHSVLCNPGFGNDYIRFVTHRDVSRADIDHTIRAVKQIMTHL